MWNSPVGSRNWDNFSGALRNLLPSISPKQNNSPVAHIISHMRKIFPYLIATLILVRFVLASDAGWLRLDDGLELGRFKAYEYTAFGDSVITILRIDPQRWDLKLVSLAATPETSTLTARDWCAHYGLAAAINAGMFHEDYRTHSGYLRCGPDVNNPQCNRYKSIAAFSPKRDSLPPFRIFDFDSLDIAPLAADYSCLIQNLRLIDRAGQNRWSPRPKQWSEAALGEDTQGRILFIFCRSPYSMYDLNNILLSLPIDLVCAQHLEGGREAQLYFKSSDMELELTGSYETDFSDSDDNSQAWPIPNVLGIVKKNR
jgi:hypothetical protein